jgi:hypothetical protein
MAFSPGDFEWTFFAGDRAERDFDGLKYNGSEATINKEILRFRFSLAGGMRCQHAEKILYGRRGGWFNRVLSARLLTPAALSRRATGVS